jgi:hypothetical protein
MPIDKAWREGVKVDKSGLWIKAMDDPYGDPEDRFDALYFQETRITLLDDNAHLDIVRKLAPQLVEEEEED